MGNEKRLEQLEQRVTELQQEAFELKLMIQALKKDEEPVFKAKEVEVQEQKEKQPGRPVVLPVQKDEMDWEKQIGQVWLPRIFIFVLLLGVIWAFKAASDYGIITAPVKVVIGYVSAFLLAFIGHKQVAKQREILGQVLLGGSVVFLLIVTFSMHVLYEMVPMMVAFGLNMVWIVYGIFLANRLNSQPLSILTAVGGYFIPFLIESENPSILNFVLFETVFYGLLLLFAMWKKYNVLYHIGFGLFHLTLLVGAILLTDFSFDTKIFAYAVMFQHLLLLLAFFVRSLFMKQQISILFSSFVVSMLWIEFSFVDVVFEGIVAGVFAVYGLLSIYLWRKEKDRLAATLSISSLALLLLFVHRYNVEDVAGLLMIQGLLSLYLGIIARTKLKQVVGFLVYSLGALSTFYTIFTDILSIAFLNWIVLLVSMLAFVRVLPLFSWLKEQEKAKRVIYVGTLLLFLYFLTLFVQAIMAGFDLNIKYMSVSIAWMVYAFASIVLGSSKDSKMLRVFGLVLLFVTLAKIIFVDLYYISLIIRAILFIGLGMIGIVGSRLFYQKRG
ncbi:DUF2339 domain-containing protein [Bacillus timonensis]|nr:DUF2339 domain-containing protein [Bacillus timonensis]